jgi:uncharacterized membrane protein YhaH (DUF805 family)
MGPVQATKTCLRKSFTYSGRASRSEFWQFAAVVFALKLCGFWLAATLNTASAGRQAHPLPTLVLIVLFALWAPLFAAASRRYSDTGVTHIPLILLAFTLVPFSLTRLIERLDTQIEMPVGFHEMPEVVLPTMIGAVLLTPVNVVLLAFPSRPHPIPSSGRT